MTDKVIRDGIEISAATAAFLDEFGMTDDEVEEMWHCSLCGGAMKAGADFYKRLCRECVESGEGDDEYDLDHDARIH